MVSNRSQLKVTTAMLQAGASALEQSHAAGHDARAACHLVFTAMLNASEWSPAIRKRPAQSPRRGKQSPANPITAYRDRFIRDYEWRGFNVQDGLHYFRDATAFPHKWIRLSDAHLVDPRMDFGLDHGWYYVSPRTAVQYLKRKHLTLL